MRKGCVAAKKILAEQSAPLLELRRAHCSAQTGLYRISHTFARPNYSFRYEARNYAVQMSKKRNKQRFLFGGLCGSIVFRIDAHDVGEAAVDVGDLAGDAGGQVGQHLSLIHI